MGRHNTIAGRMAASAAAKARLFTKLAREIMVTARAGSDLNTNAALRSAVNKAKDHSMPKDNIDRAIKKGAGDLTGVQFEEITYEGYGPCGTAILVETLTDNKNRTLPELRRLFQKYGGHLGDLGAVAWMFKKSGVFVISASQVSEDHVMEIAINSGAEDFLNEDHLITIYIEPLLFVTLREALIDAKILFEKAGIELIPEHTVSLTEDNAQGPRDLVEALENHDDVQNVFHNFIIS
jgi:YebC/PmpR family DNA-binding regulatory protein